MASALSKVPKHLSAIMDAEISAEEACSDKLIQEAAEFAAWSAAAGIPTISIYDERGILKHHAALFHVFASLRIKTLALNQKHRVSVYLEGKLSLDEEDHDGRPPSLIIYLISEDDGRCAIGDVTETFAEQIECGNIAVEEITVDLVAEQLHSLVMPAPDLIVVLRPELKLSGYPPWHLQQAKMELLRDNGKFSYVAFAHALRNYADAERRHDCVTICSAYYST
ncbi:Di-trans-poly-cis-decaprenylcistransferase-like protein [Akanthomyces lecanii RCEF 1005]|uniref:ditrans,polycis-polyprenyl diphosphate synthase [(2E,6E)-farnesyldiphosphate specific] n=1 Tax=Akanthomyces lecanii RCEF 1005 TaxID=1081108 RepID=A0A162KNY2_CORDF|nr:Di-trans-poly-cis-decaprenylcistransferase-like protein [Akanthomyces lecanii RCEF 1005]